MTEPTEVGNVLRAAAERLEEALGDLPEEDWGRRPWHAEKNTHGQAAILAQGSHRPPGRPQNPPIQHVASTENEQYATYIGLMQPAVGRPLVALLRGEARKVDGVARTYREIGCRETYGNIPAWQLLDDTASRALKLAQQILAVAPNPAPDKPLVKAGNTDDSP